MRRSHLVVALVAIIAAAVGTAAAANPPRAPSALPKQQLKRFVQKQIDRRAARLSVARARSAERAELADSAGIADRAERAGRADAADRAAVADRTAVADSAAAAEVAGFAANAGALGGKSPRDVAMWVQVDDGGLIVDPFVRRASVGGFSVTDPNGAGTPGLTRVSAPRRVDDCGVVGVPATFATDPDATPPTAVEIEVAQYFGATNTIQVGLETDTGAPIDNAYTLAILC